MQITVFGCGEIAGKSRLCSVLEHEKNGVEIADLFIL